MIKGSRRIAALVAVALMLVAAAPVNAVMLESADSPPAGDQLVLHVHELRTAGRSTARVASSPAPCKDKSYRLLDGRWRTTYRWSFRASSTPGYLSARAVASVIQKSFSNITNANNDCGLPDRVSATHRYLGTTGRKPNCNRSDGHNVIGFGRMQYGTLAVTCWWTRGERIVEADMKINTREKWALSEKSCRRYRSLLEATMTHEAGHAFGLDHVGERRHGRLTMSPFLDGPCNNQESTLGLGDVRGLEALY